MTIRLIIIFWGACLTVFGQKNDKITKQFDLSIKILDNWLVKKKVFLSADTLKYRPYNKADSLEYKRQLLADASEDCQLNWKQTIDVTEAIYFLETLTEIKSSVGQKILRCGIVCFNCSNYQKDRKEWVDWYKANKNKIPSERIKNLTGGMQN